MRTLKLQKVRFLVRVRVKSTRYHNRSVTDWQLKDCYYNNNNIKVRYDSYTTNLIIGDILLYSYVLATGSNGTSSLRSMASNEVSYTLSLV